MRNIKKIVIIGFCAVLVLLFLVHSIRINTDAILCRYFLPDDMFLLIEGEEEIELSLNVVLDGKRRSIRSFSVPDEGSVYYFFLPAGIGKQVIRMIDNLDHTIWEDIENELTDIEIEFQDGQSNIWFQINNRLSGEKRDICIWLMEGGNQPSVFVDIEENLDDLLMDKDLKVKGDIYIYDEASRLLFSGKVKFKGHGNGSWDNCKKKSWLLDFEEPTSILEMDKGYKYIAVSNALDLSYLRNKFVYDWAAEMGMSYSPNSEFGNLYVNGEYLGLYLFAEGIEVSEDRVSVQEDKDQLARVQDPALQYYEYEDEKGYILPEGIQMAENVGYLLREEVDSERYESVECGFITQNGSQFEVIYPKKATQKQIADIKEYVQKFQDAVADENGDYLEWIDLDSFVKKFLIEQISKNHDGNKRSSYYYLYAYGTDSKLYQGPVWDYDLAFGNAPDSSWQQAKGIVKLKPGLDQREEFMDCVVQYYTLYFKPYLEVEAEEKIRGYAEEIRSSVALDQIRWKYENPLLQEEFDDGVNALLSFIQIRKQFLDDVWLNGKIFYRINFVDEEDIVKTIYVEAGKSVMDELGAEYELSAEGKEFIGWYDEELEEPMDYQMEITENMAFWAKWK